MWTPVTSRYRYEGLGGADWLSSERRLAELNVRYARSPWRSFGKEAQCALLLRAGFPILPSSPDLAPPSFSRPDVGRFLSRPSAEPIIYSSWNRFTAWEIDNPWALSIAALLTGGNRRLRRVDLNKPDFLGLPPMLYAPLDRAGDWLQAVRAIQRCSGLTPLQEALLIKGTVELYHPLDDGNGRLARTMFYASLGNRSAIDAPFLALGPIIYQMSFQLLGINRTLSNSGDWNAYLDSYHCVIDAALTVQERAEDDEWVAGNSHLCESPAR